MKSLRKGNLLRGLLTHVLDDVDEFSALLHGARAGAVPVLEQLESTLLDLANTCLEHFEDSFLDRGETGEAAHHLALQPGTNVAVLTAMAHVIVTEGLAHGDPLAGDPGRLLGNMLRALQLHRHPRVFLCALSTQPGTDAQAADAALEQAVARVQPSVLLLMGRTAARAVLQRSEPLGQLRGQAHWVAGIPCVVTYDAPYLLRAPHAKPAAWADLCHVLVNLKEFIYLN